MIATVRGQRVSVIKRADALFAIYEGPWGTAEPGQDGSAARFLGYVRRFFAPSHIRRGRGQVSPSWEPITPETVGARRLTARFSRRDAIAALIDDAAAPRAAS